MLLFLLTEKVNAVGRSLLPKGKIGFLTLPFYLSRSNSRSLVIHRTGGSDFNIFTLLKGHFKNVLGPYNTVIPKLSMKTQYFPSDNNHFLISYITGLLALGVCHKVNFGNPNSSTISKILDF